MKFFLKQLRPYDFVFIIVALVISFIPNIITSYSVTKQSTESSEIVAFIKIDGKIVDEFPLSDTGDQFTKTYYPHEGQYNIIEVDQSRVRIKEDNSPDQIGVMTGWIDTPGQTAICLPHGLIIEVSGTKITNDDLILPLNQ